MYWRRLTGFISAVLPPMILILLPLVWLSEAITGFMRRRRVAEKLSREEFAALARVGEEQGVRWRASAKSRACSTNRK
jgi:hypothetical protein